MNRFAALAAALALVLSGVAIGALGAVLLLERSRRPAPPPPPPAAAPFTREMELRLDLTAEQRARIQEVLDESRREADAIRRELRPRLESHLEATRARIAALLTPEQRVKFEELVQEDRRRAERTFLEGPPPPRPEPPGPPRDDRPPPNDRPPR